MRNARHHEEIRRFIDEIDSLPPLPEAARQLLALKDNPLAGAREVAAVIEHDPAVALQLIRHAASPLFGARNKIHSIQDAITVLGNKRVMDMAMALISVRGISLAAQGALNIHWFWRHAIYTATLMQLLAEAIPDHPKRPSPATAYSTGLLHNIGVLVNAHIFTKEFAALSADFGAPPESGFKAIEEKHLATNHSETGMLLLRKWTMPAEFIVVALEHHNPRYKGEFREYANLACIAASVLARMDIGDAECADPPANLFYDLKLGPAAVQEVVTRLNGESASLETLAREMCHGTQS